jgi:hypothetical protein
MQDTSAKQDMQHSPRKQSSTRKNEESNIISEPNMEGLIICLNLIRV